MNSSRAGVPNSASLIGEMNGGELRVAIWLISVGSSKVEHQIPI
jgi:hypothetical protein